MKQIFFITFFFLAFCFTSQAQNLQEIKKIYTEGKYAEAKPGIEKLLSKTPNNASYNHWYGVCLFETGEQKASEKYLKFAASKKIQEANRYLGKLYYMQYDFKASAEAYEDYVKALETAKNVSEVNLFKPLLEKSKRAARLLAHVENIQIIDSVIVDKNKFLQYYKLGEEAGTLTASDGNKKFMYTNQLQNKRYYAKADSGDIYQLYSQVKLLDEWSDETKLSSEINVPEGNNYPFVLNNGVTVYFASKGHESIGGYDLFITRYNNNNDSYLAPEQLGMPFNSIYNDYMLAIDELHGIGYFATDRLQPEGKVVIYTFIPEDEKKKINSQDTTVLKNRALITSIKDTQVPGKDYKSFLKQVYASMSTLKDETQKDFVFVINDNIIYHTLKDFESDAAKTLFMDSQKLKKEFDESEKKLEENRKEYAKSSGNAKEKLKNTILSLEKELEEKQEKYNRLVIDSRNAEIKYLRQQNK